MSRREFKCWFPDDGDTEDTAIDVLNCLDAEDAAEEACEGRHSGPDYQDEINGDPVRVMVRDGANGAVSAWDVSVTAEIRCSAEEAADAADPRA